MLQILLVFVLATTPYKVVVLNHYESIAACTQALMDSPRPSEQKVDLLCITVGKVIEI